MVPPLLAAVTEATWAAVGEFAPVASTLRNLIDKYPNALSFMNNLRRKFTGLTPQAAGRAWAAAKFFRGQQAFLAMYGPTDIPDPRIAGRSAVSPADYFFDTPIRYGVDIDMTDPVTGVGDVMRRWVRTGYGTDLADVISAAIASQVKILWAKYALTVSTAQQEQMRARATIVQFDILYPGTQDVLVPR